MTKVKTSSYTLARGRTQPFRQTLTYLSEQQMKDSTGKPLVNSEGKPVMKMLPDPKREPVQLVFEPDLDIELTCEEVGYLRDAIAGGAIVPTNRDPKGRQKDVPKDYIPGAEEVIARLEKKVEQLSGELAAIKAGDKKKD